MNLPHATLRTSRLQHVSYVLFAKVQQLLQSGRLMCIYSLSSTALLLLFELAHYNAQSRGAVRLCSTCQWHLSARPSSSPSIMLCQRLKSLTA